MCIYIFTNPRVIKKVERVGAGCARSDNILIVVYNGPPLQKRSEKSIFGWGILLNIKINSYKEYLYVKALNEGFPFPTDVCIISLLRGKKMKNPHASFLYLSKSFYIINDCWGESMKNFQHHAYTY